MSPDSTAVNLSPRHREIAALVAAGMANKKIAAQLNLSEGTIKTYLDRIYRAHGLANRTALAVAYAKGELK